mmetsp:Transcript_95431/g.269825  ORF Transcript_95431/g.269825 Transcript_95431/m.269825 type:complete len:488 (-) Transcript_95431:113-1576(-)
MARASGSSNRSLLSRRLNTCNPSNPTCTCVNADYPCYAHYKGKCSCWGMTESMCASFSGQYCSVPDTCVPNCAQCKTDTVCRTCDDGYWTLRGQCVSGAQKFSGAGTSIHVKDNLVLLGNAEAYTALSEGYAGTLTRYEAIEFAARGFLHFYKDAFDAIMVFPWAKMDGSKAHGEQFSASRMRENGGRIASLITLQNYGPGHNAIPLLHEVLHRWGVFVDGIRGVHWGMTAFDKHGMLGGFASNTMECAQGTFPDCTTNTIRWDFGAGSAQTSNDGIGAFSKYELLLMGLQSASDLSSEPPLVHCSGASKKFGTGKEDVTCTSIDKLTPAQVHAGILESIRGTQISDGASLRMVALVLFPSASAATTEAQASSFTGGSDLEWLNTYIAGTPAKFSTAVGGRASMSFAVAEADRRQSNGDGGGSSSGGSGDGGNSGDAGNRNSSNGTGRASDDTDRDGVLLNSCTNCRVSGLSLVPMFMCVPSGYWRW